MSSLCERILNHYEATMGMADAAPRPWYLLAGGTGPNAVLKIFVAANAGQPAYVLTVARHSDTRVLSHEVAILRRLRENLPDPPRQSVPEVLDYSRCDGLDYFALPFYASSGHGRIRSRLARSRRRLWVQQWLADVGRATADRPLSKAWLEEEYVETIERVLSDPRIAGTAKRTVERHFAIVLAQAEQIPSVCCHGDLWQGNILWMRSGRPAVILDWGAARWPGLPAVDLVRYLLAGTKDDKTVAESIRAYCRAVDLDIMLVPALYDLYNVFVKAELDLAFAHQPDGKHDPFLANGTPPSSRLSQILG